jgi:hypothetical protein
VILYLSGKDAKVPPRRGLGMTLRSPDEPAGLPSCRETRPMFNVQPINSTPGFRVGLDDDQLGFNVAEPYSFYETALRAPSASSIWWPILICALPEIASVASLREGQAFRQRPCLEARWRRQQFLRQRSRRRYLCASPVRACNLRLQST